MDPVAWSYSRHERFSAEFATRDLPDSMTGRSSIDAWHERKKLGLLSPLFEAYPGSSWVTIGDGVYGSNAHFLATRGLRVVATDISDESLKLAHQRGLLPSYLKQNAEQLSLADESFEFVLCKETLHHVPRPPVAFYQMLRVARIAVVLIEPLDEQPRLLDGVRTIAKRILRPGRTSDRFEPHGNFIYRVLVGELAKWLTGLGFPTLAYRRLNHFVISALQPRAAAWTSPAYLATRLGTAAQDLLALSRLMSYGVICAVAFKQPAAAAARARLARAGFRLLDLPRNPYANEP